MNYTITTTTPYMWQGNGPNRNAGMTTRTVDTLDDARDAVVCILSQYDEDPLFPHWRSQALMLSESGGTIGPLPDGTMISARRELSVCTSIHHNEPSCRSADPHCTQMTWWCGPCLEVAREEGF